MALHPLDPESIPWSESRPATRAESPASLSIWRWPRRVAAAVLSVFLILLIYDTFAPPVSTLMMARWLTGEKFVRIAVPLNEISPNLIKAVITSEDTRFCLHHGVDWRAVRIVLIEAAAGDRPRGASTIDMQTVKNLFLFPGRFIIRKAIEVPLALSLDLLWSKRRILQTYLNIAEWGKGVYGAEAASELYFHKHASELTPREALLLAASLANPDQRDPRHPSPFYLRVAGVIGARMARNAAPLSCVRPR